jgi:hypothetical protein
MSKVVFLVKASCAALCVALSLASCATSGSATRSSATSGGGTSAAPSSRAGASSGKEPDWVETPEAFYPKFDYITGVGVGNDRSRAEQQALGALVAYFGQSVQADLRSIESYYEAVSKGAVEVNASIQIESSTKTTTAIDILIGAEMKEHWDDGRTFYALVVLEKSTAARLYSDLLASNQGMIERLTALSPEEKNSLDGFSRYQLAATIADASAVYANILSLIDGHSRTLKKGDVYRLEAVNITKSIPIAVSVNAASSGDEVRFDRIKSAFTGALNKQGFRSGGNNSRYVLEVNFSLSPDNRPGNDNQFIRYVVNASLKDTADASELFAYSINDREGHLSADAAKDRAVAAAEKKISAEYTSLLSAYLSSLLPK